MKKSAKIISLTLILTLIFSFSAFAKNPVSAPEDFVNNSQSVFSDTGKISLTPGTDSSSVNFSWVSHSFDSFRYSAFADMSDAVNADVVSVRTPLIAYVVNRVSLNGLKEGTYYYEYTFDGKTQKARPFTVKDDKDFEVAFVSDAQIGRSGDNSEEAMLDDAYGWERTVNSITEKTNSAFILSAGDQVNVAVNKKQYNAFLNPEKLKSIPIAAAVGNHEMYSQFFPYHFYNPNITDGDVLTFGGNDYYFSYSDVLFIVLNTNNFLKEDHEYTLNRAVSAYPNATARIVMMHQSAYSIQPDAFDNKANYISLPSLFEKYGIDLVLSGHDHIHARTAPINGVTYFESGNASGCNYCHVDEIPDYIENYLFMEEPTYSVLSFDDEKITVTTYGTDTDTVYDTFTVIKNTENKTVPEYEQSVFYAPFFSFVKRLLTFINTFFHIFK